MNTTHACKHLRTKAMFIPALAEHSGQSPESADEHQTAHCWCNCTLTETGPDDGPVGFKRCVASRSCFED